VRLRPLLLTGLLVTALVVPAARGAEPAGPTGDPAGWTDRQLAAPVHHGGRAGAPPTPAMPTVTTAR
jgi:hypothetical protein